jgi:bifunctional DNase/RNase
MSDMMKAEIWTIAKTEQGNAVLLRPLGSDVSVPIFIGTLETQHILIGYGKNTVKRPFTPDLFLSLVRRVGLELKRVEVHELKDDIFHARLILLGGEFSGKEPLILDSRPSDAFALAVRKKCPIYVSRKVVEQAGIPIDLIMQEQEESGPAEYPAKFPSAYAGSDESFETAEHPTQFPAEHPTKFPTEHPTQFPAEPPVKFPENTTGFSASNAAKRRNLLAELDKAVAAEEYERAAEIRDILLLLNKEEDPA